MAGCLSTHGRDGLRTAAVARIPLIVVGASVITCGLALSRRRCDEGPRLVPAVTGRQHAQRPGDPVTGTDPPPDQVLLLDPLLMHEDDAVLPPLRRLRRQFGAAVIHAAAGYVGDDSGIARTFRIDASPLGFPGERMIGRGADDGDGGTASRDRHDRLDLPATSRHLRQGLEQVVAMAVGPARVGDGRPAHGMLRRVRKAWRLFRIALLGAQVSARPFSSLAEQLAELLRRPGNEAVRDIVLVVRGPGQIDALIDLEFLAAGPVPRLHLALAPGTAREAPDDAVLDRAMLGRRLADSPLFRDARLYALVPAAAQAIAGTLDRPLHPITALPAALGATDRPDAPPAPVVTVIRPGWVNAGSNLVFNNQIEYLAERGFRVIEILLNPLFAGRDGPAHATRDILRRTRGSRAARTLVLNRRIGLAPWLRWAIAARRALRDDPLARRAAGSLLIQVPAALGAVLAARPPTFAVVNHCFTVPFARRLLPTTPFVVETHDIQSLQHEVQQRIGRDDNAGFDLHAALRTERRLLAEGRRLVSLNADETRAFRALDPAFDVTTIYPFYPARPARRGPRDEAVDRAALIAGLEDPALAPLVPGRIDVLTVASRHPASIEGVRWFLREVWAPYLADLGATAVIAGNVLEFERSALPPGVVTTGRVADLAPFYGAARLVALPVVSGAGLPIKTVEALSVGRPFVATRAAVRGIEAARPFPVHDDARAFADDIRRLLDSELLRRQRAEQGRRFAETVFNRDAYFAGWDAVIAPLLPAAGAADAPPPAPLAHATLQAARIPPR